MSYLDENPHEVKNAAYYRRQLTEYKQRAEAAEAKLRELGIRPTNLFTEDVYVMQPDSLQICSQPSTAPKQEEK